MIERREFLVKSLVGVTGLSLFGINLASAEECIYNDFNYCAIINKYDWKARNEYEKLGTVSNKIWTDHFFYYSYCGGIKSSKMYSTGDVAVYMNGEYVNCCVKANAVEGWVDCFKKIKAGDKCDSEYAYWMTPDENGELCKTIIPKLHRTYGKVQILLKDNIKKG